MQEVTSSVLLIQLHMNQVASSLPSPRTERASESCPGAGGAPSPAPICSSMPQHQVYCSLQTPARLLLALSTRSGERR